MVNDSTAPKHCVVEETIAQPIANVSDFLVAKTGLSKGRVKHALNCGALRVKKHKGGLQRLRRATASIPAGSKLSFHYDEALLALKSAPAELLEDNNEYSVWFKPPGMLSQGTEWGDHCSMLRFVEQYFENKRQVFLVHRLDRDACGLMLVAHSGSMADKLSRLFSSREMEKHYQVRVVGHPVQTEMTIDLNLDGKEARTHTKVVDTDDVSSLLNVTIETGRKHQIRRHLSLNGHPVVGDPLYGEKHPQGLHLSAVLLRFLCPVRGRKVEVIVPSEKIRNYWS